MKKLWYLLTISILFIGFALPPAIAGESSDYVMQWRAFTMPVAKWQGMPDSERMKISRFFADQFYQMDDTCTNAKVTVNEKSGSATMYVECVERGKGKPQEENNKSI